MNGRPATVESSPRPGAYVLSCGHEKTANFALEVGAETDCLRCLLAGRRLESREVATVTVDDDAPVPL